MTKPQHENGAYHYYPVGWDANPYICEIRSDYVFRIGFDGDKHVSQFPGRFVRLVEVKEKEGQGDELGR